MKMNMVGTIAVGIIILAGFAVAVANGGATASILQQSGNSFATVVQSATSPGVKGSP
jgi:hypothetical protein